MRMNIKQVKLLACGVFAGVTMSFTACDQQAENSPLSIGKSYRFYFEPGNQWIQGKLIQKSDSLWIQVEFSEGDIRWLNVDKVTNGVVLNS